MYVCDMFTVPSFLLKYNLAGLCEPRLYLECYIKIRRKLTHDKITFN